MNNSSGRLPPGPTRVRFPLGPQGIQFTQGVRAPQGSPQAHHGSPRVPTPHGPAGLPFPNGSPDVQAPRGPLTMGERMNNNPPKEGFLYGPPGQQAPHGPPGPQAPHGPPGDRASHGPPRQQSHRETMGERTRNNPPREGFPHGPPGQRAPHGPPGQPAPHGPPRHQAPHGPPRQQSHLMTMGDLTHNNPTREGFPNGPPGQGAPHGPPGQRFHHGPPGERFPHGPLKERAPHRYPEERGNQGAQKEQAPSGPQGQRGPHSPPRYRGPHGPFGERATHGHPREQAPDGPPREQFPHGPRGEGTSYGHQGEQAHHFPSGERASHGLPREQAHHGPMGDQGSHGPLEGRGPHDPMGERGPHGPMGERGPHGPMGERGPHGPMGERGPHGPLGGRGPHDPMGEQGPHGLMGERGPHGPMGERGPHGPMGERGPHGPMREQGPHGPMGERGPHGPMGERGPQGPMREQGPHGTMGERGPHGPMGERGPQGPMSKRGPNGTMGERGPHGPMGERGPHGPMREQGPYGPSMERALHDYPREEAHRGPQRERGFHDPPVERAYRDRGEQAYHDHTGEGARHGPPGGRPYRERAYDPPRKPLFGEFVCQLCNIDCLSRENSVKHEQSRIHRMAVDSFNEGVETPGARGTAPASGSDENSEMETYCDVCRIECKTARGLLAHYKSMTHILKASAAGAMETVEEEKEGTYCKICNIECHIYEDYHAHTASMGHLKQASKARGKQEGRDRQESARKKFQMEAIRKEEIERIQREEIERIEREEMERIEREEAEFLKREEMERKEREETARKQKEEFERHKRVGIDGFFCTFCKIDCCNEDGVTMHCEMRIHINRRANAEIEDVEEEEKEEMDEEVPDDTYCNVCEVKFRTPGALLVHAKSVSHMIRASEAGAMESDIERQKFDGDKGPWYCRACKIMCKDEDDFSNHTQTIGHRMKQGRYDEQQGVKHANVHASSERGQGPPEYERRPPHSYQYPNQFALPMEPRPPEKKKPQPHPDYPELLQDAIDAGISLCTLCQARVRTSDYPTHTLAPPHRRRVRAVNAGGSIYVHTAGLDTRPLPGPADAQKEIAEKESNWFIGLEYIYEIHRRTTIGKPYYFCTLCDVGYIDAAHHGTCREHRLLYFKRHNEELQEIIQPFVPRPGTEFYAWYQARYTHNPVEQDEAPKRPKSSLETQMLMRMSRAVCKKQGLKQINKHEEIRGKLVRPEGHFGKDPYPNAKPMDKWNAKRLFVTNLPPDVNEMDLFDFLNRQSINRAIIDLEIGKDKNFCVLTFRSYEDVSQFLVFDGIVFKEVELRISRPLNFTPLPGQDDAKMLQENTTPRTALLQNKVLPYPTGSKHTNSLHLKGLQIRTEPSLILDFINSLVLGTPATGLNEIELKRSDNWVGFLLFRSTEETTDVLEAALGEIFQYRPLSITRPANYVSPEEATAQKEVVKQGAQVTGVKRPSNEPLPLYTDFEKVSRLEPNVVDGMRGGSIGFVKRGDMRMPPPEQQPMEWDPSQAQGQGSAQYQGQGQMGAGGQHQSHNVYQTQGQMPGPGQGQFYGQGQPQNPYPGQGVLPPGSTSQNSAGTVKYVGPSHRGPPGPGNQGPGQVQGRHQNPGQGPSITPHGASGPPPPAPSGPPPPAPSGPPPPAPSGPPPPAPSAPPPPLPSGPPPPPPEPNVPAGYPLASEPQNGHVEFPMAKLPPPELPPPPKVTMVTQLMTMLKDSKEFLTNDTICTDEEALFSQQVTLQLTGGLNVFSSRKNLWSAPYVTTTEPPKDTDLEGWLDYMSQFLDRGRIVLDEEAALAREVVEILKEEVKKYQDRCTVPAGTAQAATSTPAAPTPAVPAAVAPPVAVPTVMPPPLNYNYQNYMGYGQYYNQYSYPPPPPGPGPGPNY